MTSFLDSKVKTEKPIKITRKPSQRYSCQDYGLAENHCNHQLHVLRGAEPIEPFLSSNELTS